MSSVRLSFGSRAGGSTDYQGGSNGTFSRNGHWSRGPFDTLDGLSESLRAEILAAKDSAVPDCTTVELHLSLNAILPLHRPGIGPYAEGGEQDLPLEFKTTTTLPDGTIQTDPFPKTSVYSILNVADHRESQIVQRAASRGIISSIEAADGYRYSFNNAWNAKEGEGARFSYICQDSMQNKDRHANGFTRTLKHLKGEGERGPRKPTYDCKGSVSVKFSTTRQSVDVYYRHYAIHPTVAERKPPPRPPPRPRIRSDSAPKDSGGLAAALQEETMQAEKYASSALQMVGSSPSNNDSPLASRTEPSNISRPLKRKRDMAPPSRTFAPPEPARQPSLMELLRQTDTAYAPAPAPEAAQQNIPAFAAPVAYELPSWQTPPPPMAKPSQAPPYQAPYPPPYQPTTQKQPQTPVGHTPARSTPNQGSTNSRKSQTAPSHPQAQGLFTTMKPVSKDWVVHQQFQAGTPGMPNHPSYNTFTQPTRAKTSCTNCRYGKKRCDEGQPCGGCRRSGRTDCIYEGAHGSHINTAAAAPPAPAVPPWQPPPANLSQSTQSSTTLGGSQGRTQNNPMAPWTGSGQQPAREPSPDPWFPKR